jgi:hypothetical protein
MTQRPIDLTGITPVAVVQTGVPPKLCWLDLDQLLIDDSYQRPLGRSNRITIRKIATEFDWSRFTPIIENAGCLFAGSGQDGGQAQDYIADNPDNQQESGSQGGSDCRARLFCFVGRLIQNLTNAAKKAKEPGNHRNVEKDEQPFEYRAEEPTTRFAQRVSAMWAIKCPWGNFLVAGRTCAGCHFTGQFNFSVCNIGINHRISGLSSVSLFLDSAKLQMPLHLRARVG